MMQSMIEVLAHWAQLRPDRLYCADTKCARTYAEAWDLVRGLAEKLRASGINEGDVLPVECTQDGRFLLLDLACQLAGIVFVPIEKKASQERVADICQETEASVLVSASAYETSCRHITMDELFDLTDAAYNESFSFPAGDKVAQILYTTGTTGKSKGIEITHANNIALAENIMYGAEMKPENVELLPLPLSHSHGLRCCYANLLNGGTIVVMDGVIQVRKIFDMMERYHVTAMDLTPGAAAMLMQLSKNRLAQFPLDYMELGTSALSEEIKALLCEHFPETRLYNFYGSTESGRSVVLDFNSEKNRKSCIGKPTKNTRLVIMDDEHHPIASSLEHPGLIATAGPMNMKGYYKHPELTEQVFYDGYLCTSDLGYMDDEGFVYVLGRKDDVINYKGIKIAPDEIEDTARKYAGVKDCACVPAPDAIAGQVPVLYVSLEDAASFSFTDFRTWLDARLDPVKRPHSIEQIDEIPRTFNGKLQRAKLAKLKA